MREEGSGLYNESVHRLSNSAALVHLMPRRAPTSQSRWASSRESRRPSVRVRVPMVGVAHSAGRAAAVAPETEVSVDGTARSAAVAECLARLRVSAAAQLAAYVVHDSVHAVAEQIAVGSVRLAHVAACVDLVAAGTTGAEAWHAHAPCVARVVPIVVVVHFVEA